MPKVNPAAQVRRKAIRTPIPISIRLVPTVIGPTSDGGSGTKITELPGTLSGLDAHGNVLGESHNVAMRRCQAHPDRAVQGLRPLAGQGGFPIAGGRDEQDDPRLGFVEELDQSGPLDDAALSPDFRFVLACGHCCLPALVP